MCDGRLFNMETHLPKGEPETPVTESELLAKFAYCTEGVYSPAKVERIVSTLGCVEDLADVRSLTGLLVPDRV